MSHTAQERYSSLVLAKLRATTIMLPLTNRKYEGDPKAGAVKIPVRDTEVSVGSYSKTSGLALDTSGSTSYQTLSINQDYAVNELIDGFDAAAVPDNLVADRLDSAGYSLALHIDNAILGLVTTFGNYTPFTTTETDVYDIVVDAVQAAKKEKVDVNALRLVVSNDFYAKVLKNSNFIHATVGGDAVIANGLVGRIAGVPVYETNNMPDKFDFILMNTEFVHFVDEWMVPVGIKDLQSPYIGASAVQGRRVYGQKVSRPTTVFVMAQEIGGLTVASSAGASSGKTAITVTESKGSGNIYKYKVGEAAEDVYFQQDVSTWTTWDGSADITAATGKKITIVEATSTGVAQKAGSDTVTAHA